MLMCTKCGYFEKGYLARKSGVCHFYGYHSPGYNSEKQICGYFPMFMCKKCGYFENIILYRNLMVFSWEA